MRTVRTEQATRSIVQGGGNKLEQPAGSEVLCGVPSSQANPLRARTLHITQIALLRDSSCDHTLHPCARNG